MKKIFVLAVAGMLAISCSKKEDSIGSEPIKKATDPVIEYYSGTGTIEPAPSSYEGLLAGSCTSPEGIYLYTPDHGPYEGQTCEIYRYLLEEDIEAKCGDEYDRKKDKVTSGDKTYYSCPFKGSNCQELDGGETGCILIFCDETEK